MILKSLRNGKLAELVQPLDQDDNVTIRLIESGEEKVIKHATLKRWWEEVLKPEIIAPEIIIESTPEPAIDPVPMVETTPGLFEGETDNELRSIIEDIAIRLGSEIFHGSVKGFRSLKVEGKMYMAFNFNKKAMTLWMRSDAIKDIAAYNKTNHMFDARIRFTTAPTVGIKASIAELVIASYDYQVAKMTVKKTK